MEEGKQIQKEKEMKKDIQILKALITEMQSGECCKECGASMYEGMCMECGYMEEELKGGQKKLDVAEPFGKLTGADFKKLRGMKKEDHEGADHEVSMANNSLDSILWAANELKKYLGDQERDIPAWIQDHITNAENYIIQAAKNFHDYGDEEAPEDGLGLTNEDLMSTLGGERPFGDSEMRKNIVEPNLGPDYDAYIMFQGPEGQYDKAKQKYVKDMAGWKQLYRSSSYQGNAYISPDGNVIKAAILSRGGIVGAIYVKKENEMSLQEMVKKVGSKYNVYSKKGKKLGSHPSKKKAQKQMAAIEISKQGK
jgi:hypothetical protein